MSEVDQIVERLKREKAESDERAKTFKKDALRYQAEANELRTLLGATKQKSYDAVNAEIDHLNGVIDDILEELPTLIAMSDEQKHAVCEALEGYKRTKIVLRGEEG